MMRFSKVLLILGIIALVSAFAMSTSFAASSEHVTKYKQYVWDSYDKKIVNVDHLEVYSNLKPSSVSSASSYKINVKKSYKNKYKINSVKVKYAVYDNSSEFEKYTYKTYNVKNKNSVNIKNPNKNTMIEQITINYYTKSKIKNESISANTFPKGEWKSTTYFYGNKSIGVLKEKGYIKRFSGGYYYASTSHNLKISTKNKKYKINKVKLAFYGIMGSFEGAKIYNGYGKNSLTIKSYGSYENSWMGDYKVYYN